jgi:ubiquinone/menaquinone biosynthesis C-methylase UbiE
LETNEIMKQAAFTQRLFDERASVYDEWVSGFWTGYQRRIDEEIKKILSRIGPLIRLLDIGCGTGSRLKQILLDLPQENFSVIAAGDLSRGMVEQAQKKLRGSSILLFQGSITDLPFPDNQFDVALALYAVLGCLADLRQRRRALKECHRVLKSGGFLMLDVLNRNHSFYRENPAYFEAARNFKREQDWTWSEGDLLVEKEPGKVSLNHGFDQEELNNLSFPLFQGGNWRCFDTETGEADPDGHFFGILEKRSQP